MTGGPTLPEFFALEEVTEEAEPTESWPNPPAKCPVNPNPDSGGTFVSGTSGTWLGGLISGQHADARPSS